MEAIGGYFSLELPLNAKGEFYPEAIKLNAGRFCLEYILRARKYKKIYLAYYTCDSVLQPIKKLGLEYEFYHIDEQLHIASYIKLKQNEALIYCNYYGLQDEYIEQLSKEYENHLIIDNSQAFYSRPIPHVDTFNTCRKFFGVANGAYLFTEKELDINIPKGYSTDCMKHLIDRIDKSPEEAFSEYHSSEAKMDQDEIRQMSRITQRIMSTIDYDAVADRRKHNYQILDSALRETNSLYITMASNTVPMVYPYLIKDGDKLRKRLIEHRVYAARYWPNVEKWASRDSFEYYFANKLLPLPIDQRYNEKDMKRIIQLIKANA